MKLERERVFPVSPETLLALLTCREFFDARHGQHHRYLAFGPTADGFLIHVEHDLTLPVERLPSSVRRLVQPRTTLEHRFLWTERQHCPYRSLFQFQLARVPVRIDGVMTLEASAEGCLQRLQADIVSPVPLLGRRIEEMVAGQVDQALERDYQATLECLRGGLGSGADGSGVPPAS